MVSISKHKSIEKLLEEYDTTKRTFEVSEQVFNAHKEKIKNALKDSFVYFLQELDNFAKFGKKLSEINGTNAVVLNLAKDGPRLHEHSDLLYMVLFKDGHYSLHMGYPHDKCTDIFVRFPKDNNTRWCLDDKDDRIDAMNFFCKNENVLANCVQIAIESNIRRNTVAIEKKIELLNRTKDEFVEQER